MNDLENSRRLERWGPSDAKVTWDEYRESIGLSGEIHMSQDVQRASARYNRVVLTALRPEDAIHIPMIRIRDGVVIDWNRSMCDLTGISRPQVVDKSFADVMETFLPNLTQEYKNASVEWLSKNHEQSKYEDEEKCRQDYLYPLPLPLCYYDAKFKYSKRKMQPMEFVELLVTRVDNFEHLYPTLLHHDGVLQYGKNAGGEFGWFFDTTDWFGGVEFTLKRKDFVPSLQTLCRASLPEDIGDDDLAVLAPYTYKQRSTLCSKKQSSAAAAATEAAESKSASYAATGHGVPSETDDKQDVYKTIADFIQTCDKTGLKYILEVLHNVRRGTRGLQRVKRFYFSSDWSTNRQTSSINKTIVYALGGSNLIAQTVEKKRMIWSTARLLQKKGTMSSEEKHVVERNIDEVQSIWRAFLIYCAPIVTENEHYHALTMEYPNRAVLTLKIEEIDHATVTDWGYGDEKSNAWATVEVPATLNFFQLH